MPYYENHSCSLFYQIIGNGSPLFFIHGYNGNSLKHWHYQLKEESLISKYKLITLDIRGFGQSHNKIMKIVNTKDVLSDIHVLLTQKLQLNSPPVFIGYSIGAVISLVYTILFPDNVKGLVLISPIPLLGTTIPTQSSNINKIIFIEKINFPKDLLWNFIKSIYSQMLSKRLKMLEQNPNDIISRMKSIKKPIIMIYGTKDSVVPKRAFDIVIKHLPNHSRVIKLPFDHGISHENPRTFNKILLEFCTQIYSNDNWSK